MATRARLLELPTELRSHIYELVAATDTLTIRNDPLAYGKHLYNMHALAKVCRQTRDEFTELYHITAPSNAPLRIFIRGFKFQSLIGFLREFGVKGTSARNDGQDSPVESLSNAQNNQCRTITVQLLPSDLRHFSAINETWWQFPHYYHASFGPDKSPVCLVRAYGQIFIIKPEPYVGLFGHRSSDECTQLAWYYSRPEFGPYPANTRCFLDAMFASIEAIHDKAIARQHAERQRVAVETADSA